MSTHPLPIPEIQHTDRGVAVWQTEHGGFSSGSLDDFVQARRRWSERRPRDPEARRELGRAYLWTGDAERAIETLTPLHRERPSDREVQSLILDALGILGRAPDQYPWVEMPALVPLDEALIDRLYAVLSGDRRPATVLDLYLVAADGGHPAFDAGDLVRALQDDGRFLVHPSNLAPECSVVLARLFRPVRAARSGGSGRGPARSRSGARFDSA